LLHNPSLFPIHRKRMLAFETLHTPEQKWYHLDEAYIIWISRSYRKTCCATVCWRQQMIALAPGTPIIIRPSGYCWIKISVEGVPKLESGHLLLTRPIVAQLQSR
jgi:hypothetical protein